MFSKQAPTPVMLPRFTWPISFDCLRVYRQYWIQFLCVFTFLSMLQNIELVHGATQNLQGCFSGTFSPDTDFFPVKLNADRARSFGITYFNNYKVVTNFGSTFGGGPETYVLYQCGTPKPAAVGALANAYFFAIPVTSVIVQDTTSVTFLEAIAVGTTIKAISPGSIDFPVLPTSPCAIQRLSSGLISNTTSYNTSLADAAFGYSAPDTSPISVQNYFAQENTVLARSEGVEYYAAFYNKEAEASTFYNYTVANYNCWKSKVNTPPTKPVVAFVSCYQGQYGSSQTGYKIGLIPDAGGILATMQSSYPNFEALAADLDRNNVTIVIDESFLPNRFPSQEDVLNNLLNGTSKDNYKWGNNIYREDGQVNSIYSYDWFDGGQVFGDNVLTDFMNIINPSLPTSDYKRTWIRNIYTEEPKVFVASQCQDYSKATVGNAPVCPGVTPLNNGGITNNGGTNNGDTGSAGKIVLSVVALLFSTLLLF